MKKIGLQIKSPYIQDYTEVNATRFKELSILETDEKQIMYTVKLPQGLSRSPGYYFCQHLIVSSSS